MAVDPVARDAAEQGRARAGPGGSARWPATWNRCRSATGVFQKDHLPERGSSRARIGKAVREIARVLDDEGVALFSEPGRGHTDAPVSAAAVRDYGVLEQDVLVGPFIRQCRDVRASETSR